MTSRDFPVDVLVVDLDGTLLRSDMLYECFWSALGRDWRSPFYAGRALSHGKPALKRYLADVSRVDAATLPYNDDVIAFIRARRDEGVQTALVTATDQEQAQEIGRHLGLFDEVHGSDGTTNLKGATKAAFIKQAFDGKRVAYLGDAEADLPVWEAVDLALTVDVPADLRARIADLKKPVHEVSTARPSAGSYIKALRPHQWLKNALVFLPMLAAHQITGVTFAQSLLAFVAFSLIASGVYVINDLFDLSADRQHPRKRARPFAAGDIPIAHGTWMVAGLLLAGTGLAVLLGGVFVLVLGLYFLTTLAYSATLKRRAVVDICVLAGLYTMRIIAGSAATGLPPSEWLIVFSMFIFLSLAAVKRQAELVDAARRDKLDAKGRGYRVEDLLVISMIALTAGYVSVMVMALYINSPAVLELYSFPTALWGVCAVLLYWITRVVLITHRGEMQDDPLVFAAKDRISHLSFLLIVGCVVAGSVL